MCTCDYYPVSHHVGWCLTLPDPLAWDEFEEYTLSEWTNNV